MNVMTRSDVHIHHTQRTSLKGYRTHLPNHPRTIRLPRLRRRLKAAIPAPPHDTRGAKPRRHPHNIMALLRHRRHSPIIIPPLESDDVGNQLIVESRAGDGRVGSQVVEEREQGGLDDGGDDAGAAGGTEDEDVGI